MASNPFFITFITVLLNVIYGITSSNDVPPHFDHATYTATIMEEDTHGLPKLILKVTAIAGDRDKPNDIVYSLSFQEKDYLGPSNRTFSIGISTGDIYILKPLDRDPPYGRPQWRFLVIAEDDKGKGLTASAVVLVNLADINDNAPVFKNTSLTGSVDENGLAGKVVMKLTALDYDTVESAYGDLTYAILQNQVNEKGQLIFAINQATGVIVTDVCCLDRETERAYVIKVAATDGGGLKGTATVTVLINDLNDNAPYLTNNHQLLVMEQSAPHKIAQLSATDDDDRSKGNGPPFTFQLDLNASESIKASFEVQNNPNRTTGDGIGILSSKVSFNRQNQVEYLVPIVIADNGSPSLTGTSMLTVTIIDSSYIAPEEFSTYYGDSAIIALVAGILFISIIIILIIALICWCNARHHRPCNHDDQNFLRDDIFRNIGEVLQCEDTSSPEMSNMTSFIYSDGSSVEPIYDSLIQQQLFQNKTPMDVERKPLISSLAAVVLKPNALDFREHIQTVVDHYDHQPNTSHWDTLRLYKYEGNGSPNGSLSDLSVSGNEEDEQIHMFDQIKEFGDKFNGLKAMFREQKQRKIARAKWE